ncbi:MAG: carbohydrate kinase [Saprospiraceae bacterium]|nr:carbohydrate kinase [Saprospiraceae bacterium]
MLSTPQVFCFGETLWDLLPSGKIAGGAPMNVAFQLNQLHVATGMISRIGQDDLGDALLAFLKDKNVPTQWVQSDFIYPTGTVKVEFNAQRQPQYEIVENVAWDFITLEPDAFEAVGAAKVLVFGSLAARSAGAKQTLMHLIDHAETCVFDVNLRKPFFSPSLLEELLAKAQIVKMNDEELDIIAAWQGIEGDQPTKMQALCNTFQFNLCIVTRGENGALCLSPKGFDTHPGYKVTVQDTIGSGDAFLAGFLARYLQGADPVDCLAFACKMGAYVATKRGGTPELNQEIIANLLPSNN